MYNQIYLTLSNKEKEILFSLCNHEKISDVLDELNISNSYFQVYKRNLSKRGIINTSSRGKITFSLLRFKEFLLFKKELEE